MSFFQRHTREVNMTSIFSRRLRDLGIRYSYVILPTTYDFRAEGPMVLGVLYIHSKILLIHRIR